METLMKLAQAFQKKKFYTIAGCLSLEIGTLLFSFFAVHIESFFFML